MKHSQISHFIDNVWDRDIVPQLQEYILIPNKSPVFDPDWEANGHMERAVSLMSGWCRQQTINGMKLSIERLPGRTPLIFIEIPSNANMTAKPVLLYGHLDKQPEMSGWRNGLGPWEPVLEGDKLYGRGGADDGYAIYGCLAAVMALQEQAVPHADLKILIEASEESGSPDLPAYVEALRDKIGEPDLVICLDSGCGNYEQLWCTTSLRGMVTGSVNVNMLEEGVHSGDASGIVPSSFRVLRQLISRLENEITGEILGDEFSVDIPTQRVTQAQQAAAVLGKQVFDKFPLCEGVSPVSDQIAELVLNRTWRPALEITGIDGAPAVGDAGNVLRPFTKIKFSLRIPPTANARSAAAIVKQRFCDNPPYNTRVEYQQMQANSGWHAPTMVPWLAQSVENSSQHFFQKPAMFMGEGGSIPFMGMLGELFPQAQFLVTGVLGPLSNAHGPNEFLHIPMGKRVTACVAQTLADHYAATKSGV